MNRLAAPFAAVAFAIFASVGHAADSVTSRAIDNQDVNSVQGRAAPQAAPGSRIALRAISDVSAVAGRSSHIARAGKAQLGAMLDAHRFGRA